MKQLVAVPSLGWQPRGATSERGLPGPPRSFWQYPDLSVIDKVDGQPPLLKGREWAGGPKVCTLGEGTASAGCSLEGYTIKREEQPVVAVPPKAGKPTGGVVPTGEAVPTKAGMPAGCLKGGTGYSSTGWEACRVPQQAVKSAGGVLYPLGEEQPVLAVPPCTFSWWPSMYHQEGPLNESAVEQPVVAVPWL